ncbi:hypothetical protein [Paracoccus sp. PAR01]|nr:hypothetical protein [Paracoccus sp. PAR01]MBD9527847.1 hypothetical protein [Paracoccus sp. PAR01]
MARDQLIRITLTPAEKAEVEAAAERAGLPPATWVRVMALQAARSGRPSQ